MIKENDSLMHEWLELQFKVPYNKLESKPTRCNQYFLYMSGFGIIKEYAHWLSSSWKPNKKDKQIKKKTKLIKLYRMREH